MTDTLSLIQATWIGRVIEITSLVLILISDVDTFELRHGEVWSLLTLMSSLTIKFGTRLMLWRKEWFEPQTWRGVMSFAMPPLLMSMSGCLTSSSTTWWCRRWDCGEEGSGDREKVRHLDSQLNLVTRGKMDYWNGNYCYDLYVDKQARKARRCNSYPQIWNYQSVTHSLTHPLTGVTARRCYRI